MTAVWPAPETDPVAETDLAAHVAKTANVHGIADAAQLVYAADLSSEALARANADTAEVQARQAADATKQDLAQKDQPSGYPGLDASGKLAVAQIPFQAPADASATTKGVVKLAGDLSGTADVPTVPGLATEAQARADAVTAETTARTAAVTAEAQARSDADAAETAARTAADATKQDLSQKNQPGGYSGLDANGLLAPAQLPLRRRLVSGGSISDAVTVTMNTTDQEVWFTGQLVGDTAITVNGLQAGQLLVLLLAQDTTGNHGLTVGVGASVATVTTRMTSSAVTVVRCYYDGTNLYVEA